MSGVLGVFESREGLMGALIHVKSQGLHNVQAFSPVLDEELLEMAAPGKSPVWRLALLGGVTGGIFGLALTLWTTYQWPLLISGGKPLLSLPPFFVVAYTQVILLGAFGTLFGFLYWAFRSRSRNRAPYDRRFSDTHFGLWVACPQGDTDRVARLLKQQGAIEWRLF